MWNKEQVGGYCVWKVTPEVLGMIFEEMPLMKVLILMSPIGKLELELLDSMNVRIYDNTPISNLLEIIVKEEIALGCEIQFI